MHQDNTADALEEFRKKRAGAPPVFGARPRKSPQPEHPESLPQYVDAERGLPIAEKPRYGHAPPHEHATDSGSAKTVLLCVGIAFLLILSLALGAWLLTHSGQETPTPSPYQAVQPHHNTDAIPEVHIAGAPPPLEQDISEHLQNVRVFYFQFTTGTQVQSRERYPLEGGIPNITIQSLMDYNVCCSSQENRFVCAGGTAFSGNGMFMEAYLEKDSTDDEVYLLLWINSKDLIEVGCWLKGTLVVN